MAMGSFKLAPARRTDTQPASHAQLALPLYANSIAPEAVGVASLHSMMRTRRDDRFAVSILSATAGYIDAVGFLMLVGLFPAHVTGEIVGVTTAFTAGHQLSHPSRYAVIPVFIAALFLAAIVTRSRRKHGKSPLGVLLGLMTVALGVCAATGFWGPLHPPATQTWVLGVRECSVMAAMAFQNAYTREGLVSACPTTVMTGNLTQLAFEVVDAVAVRLGFDRTEDTREWTAAGSRFKLVAGALGSFLVGAVFGGYLTGIVGAFSILVPMAAALLLAKRIA